MQLQSQSDLGLDANLLLVEDFSNCECIDMLNKKIEVNVAAFAKTNNLILGDKAAAGFTRFKSAKKVATTTRYLDLTN